MDGEHIFELLHTDKKIKTTKPLATPIETENWCALRGTWYLSPRRLEAEATRLSAQTITRTSRHVLSCAVTSRPVLLCSCFKHERQVEETKGRKGKQDANAPLLYAPPPPPLPSLDFSPRVYASW